MAKKPKALGKERFAVLRDGELIGIGLVRTEAVAFVREMWEAYPEHNFSIVPGGEVVPGNKEKK